MTRKNRCKDQGIFSHKNYWTRHEKKRSVVNFTVCSFSIVL